MGVSYQKKSAKNSFSEKSQENFTFMLGKYCQYFLISAKIENSTYYCQLRGNGDGCKCVY